MEDNKVTLTDKDLAEIEHNKHLTTADWVLLVMAVLYGASPVDIVPDMIPGIGHIDDAIVLGVAAFNTIQSLSGEHYKIFKILKWVCIGLGIALFIVLLAMLQLGILAFKTVVTGLS